MIDRIDLDACFCPACCVPAELVEYDEGMGWELMCDQCGYTAFGMRPDPTLRALALGEADFGNGWRDVDLARWSRLVATAVRQEGSDSGGCVVDESCSLVDRDDDDGMGRACAECGRFLGDSHSAGCSCCSMGLDAQEASGG